MVQGSTCQVHIAPYFGISTATYRKLNMKTPPLLIAGFLLVITLLVLQVDVYGHGPTRHKFLQARRLAQAKADRQAEEPAGTNGSRDTCQLTIDLVDRETRRSLPGLVRATNLSSGKAVKLNGLIHRAMNWYAMPEKATVEVPRTQLKIEAFWGLETERQKIVVDLTDRDNSTVQLPLNRFHDAAAKGLKSGNTHLHLTRITHAEAHRYLQIVPRADNLDLVYLSYLRRLPDERNYISNEIVFNSFTGGDLKRLSQQEVLFTNGEEHRHNFGRGGEGYGHVMLLDLVKLILPVSIGPGIMQSGTDGIPLQRGIQTAREDGASVIWCHNTFGFEDVPNWMEGLLDAQNIFDGGTQGSYQDSFYRYLNLGLHVPFSTGTDWFIYDFSRVYVPIDGELSSEKWLVQLAAGRTYITNGTFLEFQAAGRQVGDTIHLSDPAEIAIRGRGSGRNDFGTLQAVHNGKVVGAAEAVAVGGHFAADIQLTFQVDGPGWVALRVAPNPDKKNELDQPLFAHTSPIYIEIGSRRIFDPDIARELISEIEQNIEVIKSKGTFADQAERDAVLNVHRRGIESLRQRLELHQ